MCRVFILVVFVLLSLVLPTYGYNCTQGNVADKLAYDSEASAASDPTSVIFALDKSCSECFGEKGYCIDKAVDDLKEMKYYKVTYRQFYDCTKGGNTITTSGTDDGGANYTTTQKYCEFKPNVKYYAVIIIPVLAFSFAIMGLACYLRFKFSKSYNQPASSENKDIYRSLEMTSII